MGVQINFQSNVYPPGMDIGVTNLAVQSFGVGTANPVQMDCCGRLLVTEEHLKPTYRSGAAGQTLYSTAAATYGTGHAIMGARYMGVMAPAATNIALPVTWDFCVNNDKPLILRGTDDVIQVYNTITGLGAGTFGYEVEWEEDNS